MNGAEDVNEFWRQLTTDAADRDGAVHDAYQALENAGLINRVTVHRFICRKRGCVLANVISVDHKIIARTRDYKLSPGVNAERSVADARENNTLDRNRHWPGYTVDVGHLNAPGMAIDMNCRHVLRTVSTAEILEAVNGVEPGHPRSPTKL